MTPKRNGNGNGNQSWINAVSTLPIFLSMVLSLAFTGWTVFQAQLKTTDEKIQLVKEAGQVIDQALKKEMLRRETEIKSLIKDIEHELDNRRDQFVTQYEFKQFGKMVEDYMRRPYLSTDAFNAWKTERDARLASILDRITVIESEHLRSRPPK